MTRASRCLLALVTILCPVAQPARAADDDDRVPVRLAVYGETAAGVTGGSFQNHLLGGRLDLLFSETVSFGASVAYVNLKGKEGRTHGLLPLAQLEVAPFLDGGRRWALPLSFATGYLARNGPVVRASAGVAWKMGQDVWLAVHLFAPTVWVTNDQTLASFNLGLELRGTPGAGVPADSR